MAALTHILVSRLSRPIGKCHPRPNRVFLHLPEGKIYVLGCNRTSNGGRAPSHCQQTRQRTHARYYPVFWNCRGHGWCTGVVHSLYAHCLIPLHLHSRAYLSKGPFELTKTSAQISVLMAKSNTSSMDDPVRSSYQQKGTFSTVKNIVTHRGVLGLYSGFGFHMCRSLIFHPVTHTERRQ